MTLYINKIEYRESLVDGPGLRSLVFFQGCDLHCKGCQNPATWDIKKGQSIEVKDLADELKTRVHNKKITITGGEPLLQKEALIELLDLLEGYDIALYTGHDISDVPDEVLNKITYLKYGPFILEEKTTVEPFYGSRNQKFMKVRQ